MTRSYTFVRSKELPPGAKLPLQTPLLPPTTATHTPTASAEGAAAAAASSSGLVVDLLGERLGLGSFGARFVGNATARGGTDVAAGEPGAADAEWKVEMTWHIRIGPPDHYE